MQMARRHSQGGVCYASIASKSRLTNTSAVFSAVQQKASDVDIEHGHGGGRFAFKSKSVSAPHALLEATDEQIDILVTLIEY